MKWEQLSQKASYTRLYSSQWSIRTRKLGCEFNCIAEQNAPHFRHFATQISACIAVFTMQNHIPTSASWWMNGNLLYKIFKQIRILNETHIIMHNLKQWNWKQLKFWKYVFFFVLFFWFLVFCFVLFFFVLCFFCFIFVFVLFLCLFCLFVLFCFVLFCFVYIFRFMP